MKMENLEKEPISTCLPWLLGSYIMTRNEELEKKILHVMMRMWNQRNEIRQNVKLL